jgi:putative MATE family efflux protein
VKNEQGCGKALGSTVILFVIFALILTPVMWILAKPLAQLMQTPAQAFAETVHYLSICALGVPFIVIFNITAAIFRGVGDSKTPMLIVAVACAVNIAGDFILTGALGMGVIGVAIATASAQAISSMVGVIIMLKRKLPFAVRKSEIRLHRQEGVNIIKVGLPIAMQDTLINISFIVLTVIANERGLIASSAVGVVEKLIMFMFLVPSSMLSAISAFTAQNVGAGKPERAVAAVKFGIGITALFGAAMCAISWTAPGLLTSIFSKEQAVILAANGYLKTYSIDCILVAVTFCLNGYLCGCEKSLVTFAHNTISIFLVRIPAAYFLSKAFPNSMLPMGLASPMGSLLPICILAGYFAFQKRKSRKQQEL